MEILTRISGICRLVNEYLTGAYDLKIMDVDDLINNKDNIIIIVFSQRLYFLQLRPFYNDLLTQCYAKHKAQWAGDHALSESVRSSDIQSVKMIISDDNSAIYNQGGELDWTPLHWATWNMHEDRADIVRLLIDSGAEINAFDGINSTALGHAVVTNCPLCIEALLSYNVIHIDIIRSALIQSRTREYVECTRILEKYCENRI